MIKKTILSFLGLVLLSIALIQTPFAKDLLRKELEREISYRLDSEVHIQSIEGFLPFSVQIQALEIIPPQGIDKIFLEKGEATLSPGTLFHPWRLHFTHISLKGVKVGDRSPLEMHAKGSVNPLARTFNLDCQADEDSPLIHIRRELGEGIHYNVFWNKQQLTLEAEGIILPGQDPNLLSKGNLIATMEDGAEIWGTRSFYTLSKDYSFHLSGEHLKGQGRITNKLEIDNAALDLLIDDILPFGWVAGIPLRGDIKVSLKVSGSLEAPSCELELEGKSLQFLSYPIEKLKGKLNAVPRNGSFEGSFNLSSKFLNHPATAEGSFVFTPGKTLELNKIKVEALTSKLSGSLNYSFETGLWEGELSPESSNLSQWSQFFHEHLRGHLKAEIKLFPNGTYQGASYDVKAEKLWWRGLHAEMAHARGTLTDLSKVKGSINLDLKHAHLQHWYIDNLSGKWKHNEDVRPFQVNAEGHLLHTAHLQKDGRHRFSIECFGEVSEEESWKLRVDQLAGQAFSQPLRLKSPLHLKSGELQPCELLIGHGSLQAEWKNAGEDSQASLRANDVPMELATLLFPELPWTGNLSGEAILNGDLSKPQGAMKFTGSQVRFYDIGFEKSPPLQMEISGDLENEKFTFSTSIDGFGNGPSKVNGYIPVHFQENFRPQLIRSNPFAVEVDVDAPLAPMLELFVTDTQHFGGMIQGQLTLRGTLSSPQILGKATLTNGRYENPFSGSSFRDITIAVRGEASEIILDHFSGTDATGGLITGKGSMLLDFSQNCPFNLDFEVDQAEIVKLDHAYASGSGMLNLKGNLRGAKLSGDLVVGRAHIGIPDKLPVKIPSLDVVYINQPVAEKKVRKRPPLFPLVYDVHIHAPGKVYVKGRGLDSEWKGDIHLMGKTKEPELKGILQVVKGKFVFSQKVFTLNKKSKIEFDHEKAGKAFLDVSADLDFDSLQVTASLKGPMQSPEIHFASSPGKPVKEILAHVLFNTTTAEMTAFQAFELAQAMSKLSGSRLPDIMGTIKDGIGIDKLGISTKSPNGETIDLEDEEVSIHVGKYIVDGVLISYNKNVTTEDNQLSIEAQISRNVQLQAEVGDNSEGKMLIKWKHNY